MTTPKQKPGLSKQDYSTPDNFMEVVKNYLWINEFDVDLAADESNHKASEWFGPGSKTFEDSLDPHCNWENWTDVNKWAWLNPPFADIRPWAEKCAETVLNYDVRIAFLVPASVGSNWYRDYIHGINSKVLFLNGRLAFMPDKPTWLYPKDCMLVLFGKHFGGFEVWDWRA